MLDLSRNKISDLSDLHKKMGNVKKLSLSSNSIISLQGKEYTEAHNEGQGMCPLWSVVVDTNHLLTLSLLP